MLRSLHKRVLSKENNEISSTEHTRLFVQDVLDFSSQYGKENSNSYTVSNIRARPHYFPKYGDFLGNIEIIFSFYFVAKKK